MKILYVDLEFHYGKKSQGPNYIGRDGFKESMVRLGHQVVPFYYDSYLQSIDALQAEVVRVATEVKPDILFFCLMDDQFRPATLETLKTIGKTVNWFGDDTWRFASFTAKYAPHFSHCISTDKFSIPGYHRVGQKNVILSQWAAIPLDTPPVLTTDFRYEVSFVGGFSPYRQWFFRVLEKSGMKVTTFGHGWENGPVTGDQMQEIFRVSKINLNISNSVSYDARYLFSHPRNLVNTLRSAKTLGQIKARNFEIPYYGGFQVSDFFPGIEDYFHLGEEIACFREIEEAVMLIQYYLTNEEIRLRIRDQSHKKAWDQHSYLNRFADILPQLS